jgi:spermidine synthase
MKTKELISREHLSKSFAFLLGLSSAVAQLLVMRELVTAFYGNELAYNFALTSWLVGIALGAWGWNVLVKGRGGISSLLILTGLLIPLTILAIRLSRNVLGLPPGQIIDLFPLAGLSLLIILPLTVSLGAFFTALVRDSGVEGIKVYILETLGFAAGGLLFSMLFIHVAWPLEMAFGLAFLYLAAYVFSTRSKAGWVALTLATWILGAFAAGYLAHWDGVSRSWQWQGYSLIAVEDSPYGSLALLKRGREESLFENGQHVFTTNDRMTAEDAAHFALLTHPSPRQVLLVGGGPSGVISEILKYPDIRVDYIELDPAAVRMAARLPFAKVSWLRDTRVRVFSDDARRFIRRDPTPRYDVVIINLGDPVTLFTNRYYTRDFFSEAARVMNKDAIISVGVTASENYVSEEGRAYLRSVRSTLQQVFPELAVVPGERYVFLAGTGPEKLILSPAILAKHRKERRIETGFVNEHYLPFRLEPGRMLEAQKILAQNGAVNSDRRPVGFLKGLVFWSTHFEPFFTRAVGAFERFGNILWLAPFLLCFGMIFRRKAPGAAAYPLVFVAGFVQMALQVIVILLFQAYYGYVYSVLGFVAAGFMFGAFIGAWAAKIFWRESRKAIVVLTVQVAASLYPLVFLLWRSALPDTLATVLAMVLSFGAGCLGGLQFALGNKLAEGKATAELYALDVGGAALAAILVGIFLVPLWGVDRTAVYCAGLNLAVAVILIVLRLGQDRRTTHPAK